MKQKKFFFLTILLTIFLSFQVVNASNLCTSSKSNELKREANKVELSWNLKYDDQNHYYFEIKVSNMSKNLLINFGNIIYDGNELGSSFTFKNMLDGGTKYNIKFYGGYDNPCVEEYITTKVVEIPKYNIYSEEKQCQTYPDFPLCDKFYDGEIKNYEDFMKKFNEYTKDPVNQKKDENSNFFIKIVDFYWEHKIITIPITALIVGSIGYFVVKKSKIKSKNKR